SNLFEQMDNSVNNNDDEVGLKPVDKSRPLTTTKGKQKEEKKDDEERKEEGTEDRGYTFTLFEKKEGPIRNKTLFDKVEGEEEGEEGEEGEDGLFGGDDEGFDQGNEISSDQVLNEEGMMEYRKTKERLQQQARERRERLKAAKKHEMTKEEFNEKWSLPAYLRRGVKMGNVPHSSEPYISRYNLNDENSILGNNKFLHDNVD
ncbi:MAG TPA: hypothetical protein PKW06_13455, partial [Cyclobacteriaceae bacterium]|nr:hypothetical protein [Cyclobacteriaceae bacterium]